ncbi:hypothetical protein [Streptomyces sp. N50]|uniref:Vgb family protein n=1 Tax=Streptomyces sp. N50 TaxID=3081765 RepID=UPI0029622DA3|nr:hypothetical protein [Streptomyces sp. N50]WOX12556.1 hypothetical protein R2B38_28640 [Streptomyces sp. N50]
MTKSVRLPANAGPSDLALSGDGELWVTEAPLGAVARVTTVGTVTQFRIPGSSNDPSGILSGPDGKMWFVGFEVIGKVDDTGSMTGWEGTAPGLPNAITLGPDGAVWYTNGGLGNASISRVTDEGGPVTTAVLPKDIEFPARGITEGPDGSSVWFSELSPGYGKDSIGRVGTDSRYSKWSLPQGTVPQSITSGPDDAVWFTTRTGIGRITSSGRITIYRVGHDKRPTDITTGPGGALWFTTPTRVGRITIGGKITLWSVPGAKSLNTIIPAAGSGFWLTDRDAAVIHRIQTPR